MIRVAEGRRIVALEEHKEVYSTFLHLIKAFDTVPHYLLINKLSDIGLSSFIICWICFYLTDRKQVVVLNACSSAECNVTSGVSQGSVLGLLQWRQKHIMTGPARPRACDYA